MENILFHKLKSIIGRFPGIGNKLATRITFFILNNKEFNRLLRKELKYVENKINNCEVCNNFTSEKICLACKNLVPGNKLCIVSNNNDYYQIYDKNIFKGNYFILNEEIDVSVPNKPIKNINKLFSFIQKSNFIEIILATSSTISGELTSNFLIKVLAPLKIKITKLAYGIPIGSEIENIDDYTLKHAFQNRKKQ